MKRLKHAMAAWYNRERFRINWVAAEEVNLYENFHRWCRYLHTHEIRYARRRYRLSESQMVRDRGWGWGSTGNLLCSVSLKLGHVNANLEKPEYEGAQVTAYLTVSWPFS